MKLLGKILLVVIITLVGAAVTCGGNMMIPGMFPNFFRDFEAPDNNLGILYILWLIEIIVILWGSIKLVNQKLKSSVNKTINTVNMSNKMRLGWGLAIFWLTFGGLIWIFFGAGWEYVSMTFFSPQLLFYVIGIWCIIALIQNSNFFDERKKVSILLFLLWYFGSRLFPLFQMYSYGYTEGQSRYYWINLGIIIFGIVFGGYLLFAWFRGKNISPEHLKKYWNYFWILLVLFSSILPIIIGQLI